jgi:RNA polymerase sigma-70 factor, ECF subfamily
MSAAQQHESLWREHRDRLYRFVRGRVDDAATAEDIVHDVLVRAWTHRDSLRNDGRFEQWLYQITRNAVIDHYRARKPTAELPDNLPDPQSADGRRTEAELAQCLIPFISALPQHYRAAIELADMGGLTQQDTAAQLGLSLSGAKSRVQRGRRLLADMLLECCRVEFDSAGGIMSWESRSCGTGDGCGDC